jgi:hypothetical protein
MDDILKFIVWSYLNTYKDNSYHMIVLEKIIPKTIASFSNMFQFFLNKYILSY